MKRHLPFLVVVLALAYLGSTLRESAPQKPFDLAAFGRVPVLVNGRIKPLDTVARTSILTMQGRQTVKTPDGQSLSPAAWLADVLFSPSVADHYRHFLIENREVLDLLGLTPEQGDKGKRFSYSQIRAKAPELDRQARLAEAVEAPLRTAFQRQVTAVRSRVVLYLQLTATLQPPDSKDFYRELLDLEKKLPATVAAFRAEKAGQTHDVELLKAARVEADRFAYMNQLGYLRTVPPDAKDADPTHWSTMGGTLSDSLLTGTLHRWAVDYASIGDAWRSRDAGRFNEITRRLHDELGVRYPMAMRKSDIEARFNGAEPFYSSAVLYVAAFLLGVASWLSVGDLARRSAVGLMSLAFVASTLGIATRMWLEGRPPVTNLYSSALFVGWAAVLLCLILERFHRNAVGTVAGGMIGLATLVIAHHLSVGGDTLEMMRAVLDSNFWLATHVVVITAGYSATYLAGFLAIIYVLRGVISKSLDRATADSLMRMVYGVVCFATLFSLTGTVLGGIWADQSWGRFWGWDPKENGALIIVIWNAVLLHARLGGLVRERGFMAMAIFGNIVTSWSWFGTNMLGVGLHSYGFMDSAFFALIGFVLSQLLLIALALIPLHKWRSPMLARG